MSRVEININPQILRWAREEAGFDPVEIADKADIATERYKLWEKEGKNIPLGKLKVIANSYKRQLAVFLLPTVPTKITKPKDYRNLSPADSKFSKRILDVIRDVTYFTETAFELQGETYWNSRYEWLYNLKEIDYSHSNINESLRDLLDISIDDQLNWRTDSEAYKKWRNAVENRLGILVFQFSMPMEEVHGFSVTEKYPYAIVTNSNHSYTGRIFTIFHELAHIIRHQSGICLYEKATERQKEEWECNILAGKFLAPDNLIEQTNDLKEISAFASKLKISREAYLRRLKEEKKISDLAFYNLLDKIKSTYKKEKKKSGFVKPIIKSKATRGETFFNMVVEALYSNQISYTKASSTLDLNVSALLHEV
jgi:Zn-dependent peptidase ImmA (M78 family)